MNDQLQFLQAHKTQDSAGHLCNKTCTDKSVNFQIATAQISFIHIEFANQNNQDQNFPTFPHAKVWDK